MSTSKITKTPAYGQFKQALKLQNAALNYLKEIQAPHIRWRIFSARGSTWRSLGNQSAATDDFEEAITIIETIRYDIKEEKYRISFFGDDPLSVYNKIIMHLLALQQPAAAIHYIEQSRSRTFLERLGGILTGKPLKWKELKSLLI